MLILIKLIQILFLCPLQIAFKKFFSVFKVLLGIGFCLVYGGKALV